MATINGTTDNDKLNGTSGADVIDGLAGKDIMTGFGDDDTYYVDNVGDKVVEAAGGGNDTVNSSVSFSVAKLANVENVTLTGTDDIDATGNAANNWLHGNDGDNTLLGGAGDDQIYGGLHGFDVVDGGKGADTMIGGDDTTIYYVDNKADSIIESFNAGYDIVYSSAVLDTGWKNVEAYHFTTSADLFFWGYNASIIDGGSGDDKLGVTLNSTLDCELYGNLGDDTLQGGVGNDHLLGGKGADQMSGGLGDDSYYVDNAKDSVLEGSKEGTDIIYSGITINALAGNVEMLQLLGTVAINGTGNDLDNSIQGNLGNNILDGGKGADAMSGWKGNDTYIVDEAGDSVQELANEGTDLVKSSISYVLGADIENLTLTGSDNIHGTGNKFDNVIVGNDGNNHLIGGAGKDTMTGGKGDDTYDVDSIGDKIVEAAGGGVDEVYSTIDFSLAGLANVEHVSLFGLGDIDATGNALNNHLDGNDGNNVLDGGKGIDAMRGRLGDDTYHVDNAGDFVIEDFGAGTGNDTIISTITLANIVANVENYTFNTAAAVNFTGDAGDNVIKGGAGADILDGAGGHDSLYGGAGNDTVAGGALDDLLDGGKGADILHGGNGNDVYLVDNVGDDVQETGGMNSGKDVVFSTVSVDLLWHDVESLQLQGTGALHATGNNLDNIIGGNDAANAIDGGFGIDFLFGHKGNDTLTGGDGSDTFRFDLTAAGNEGHDIITDFVKAEDVLSFQVGDVNNDGNITLDDLLGSTTVVDHGAGKAVDVHFADGGEITFLGAGTANNTVHTIDQLVAATGQIHVN